MLLYHGIERDFDFAVEMIHLTSTMAFATGEKMSNSNPTRIGIPKGNHSILAYNSSFNGSCTATL